MRLVGPKAVGAYAPPRPNIRALRLKNTKTNFCLGYDYITDEERDCPHVIPPRAQKVVLPDLPPLPVPIKKEPPMHVMGQPMRDFSQQGEQSMSEILDHIIDMRHAKWMTEKYQCPLYKHMSKIEAGIEKERRRERLADRNCRDPARGIQLGYEYDKAKHWNTSYGHMSASDEVIDQLKPKKLTDGGNVSGAEGNYV